MAKWWIGCSGFHYKHWKGSFYPDKLAQKNWFDHYSKHFKTLELNVTFYRFPRLPYLKNWYNQSPNDFTFSVKAPKAITHYKKFKDCERFLQDFYGTTREGLKDKLGCILFQLPEKVSYKHDKLQQIIESLDPGFKNVLEFRNESWWNPKVYQKLATHNISFCGMSHPSLPDFVIQNTKTVYFRFHGVPELYKSKYSLKTLKKVADEIENNPLTKEAFIYFNNDIDTSAIDNALQMIRYLDRLKKKDK
jgi:uncharacterized protein YecE (DUF72 family)